MCRKFLERLFVGPLRLPNLSPVHSFLISRISSSVMSWNFTFFLEFEEFSQHPATEPQV